MLSAAIDVGSNTIRMLIATFHDNSLSRIHTDRAITRLAQGLNETGKLREENIEKSIAALKGFSHSIEKYGVTRIKAVGTSAIRDAKNRNEFLGAAFRETGIKVEAISGIREAELTIKGVLLGFRDNAYQSLIIDIGGGSTEWIMHTTAKQHEPLLCGTVPAGVVNLLERFIKTDPPTNIEISAMLNEVDSLFRPLKHEIAEYPSAVLIGTGGTITTLASIDLNLREYDSERVHMHNISVDRLKEIRNTLLSLTFNRRKDIAGLEAGRADLIIPGILLTIRIMEIFGFKDITVSDCGLLEGILKEMKDEEGL